MTTKEKIALILNSALDSGNEADFISGEELAGRCNVSRAAVHKAVCALREQGFSSSNKMQNEWTAWSESERSVMEQILLKHGLRREDKNVHRQHMSVEDYKKAALKAEQINKLNAHINELKKKPVEELTPEEVTLIKNQNDFMRGEIINRNEIT